MKPTIAPRRARPPYLRLLPPCEPFTVRTELGAGGSEVVVVTVPRDQRLLAEMRLRLGDRLRPYRVTPETLTFAVDEEPLASCLP